MPNKSTKAALALVASSFLLLAGCSSPADSNVGNVPADPGNQDENAQTPDSGEDDSNDEGAPEAGGAADCFIEFFDAENFDEGDDHFKLTEPGDYEDLDNLPGADKSWTDEADSLRVGNGATVTIWEDTNFGGSSQDLQPGTEIADVDNEPSSLKMSC